MANYNFKKRYLAAEPRRGRLTEDIQEAAESGGAMGATPVTDQLWQVVTTDEKGNPLPEGVVYLRPVNGGSIVTPGNVVAYAKGPLNPEQLPIAGSILGCVKQGKNIKIEKDGTINAVASGEGGKVESYKKDIETLPDYPTTFPPASHSHGYASKIKVNNRTYQVSSDNEIALPDYPGKLPNSYSLTIKFNGVDHISYDGSSYKEINITPSNIGAMSAASWTWNPQAEGQPTYVWGGDSEGAYLPYNPSNFNVAKAVELNGETPQLAASDAWEGNGIRVVKNDNGTISNLTSENQTAALRKAIEFSWNTSSWQIGNVRGLGYDSWGFGIVSQGYCYMLVNTDGARVFGSLIATGNVVAYRAGNTRATPMRAMAAAPKVATPMAATPMAATPEDESLCPFSYYYPYIEEVDGEQYLDWALNSSEHCPPRTNLTAMVSKAFVEAMMEKDTRIANLEQQIRELTERMNKLDLNTKAQ